MKLIQNWFTLVELLILISLAGFILSLAYDFSPGKSEIHWYEFVQKKQKLCNSIHWNFTFWVNRNWSETENDDDFWTKCESF
jgi:hypothetical protein